MKTTAIILSGGRGSRVGNADKGLLPWGDSSLVAAVLERIEPQVDQIIISCNRNREEYEAFGYPLVGDELPDYQGPLAGIASALEALTTERAVVVPCDCPTLPSDLVLRLSQALDAKSLHICWAYDGERNQYLFCAMQRSVLPGLLAYLESGQRSVHGWQQQIDGTAVDFSDQAKAFCNLNRLP